MLTEEDVYVNGRMTWFDRVCQWSWSVPAGMVFVLIGNGMIGEPLSREGLVLIFLGTFGLSVVMRGIVLPLRIQRLRMQYFQEKRIKP